MIRVDDVQSEVVVEGGSSGGGSSRATREEELREIVRKLVVEELERFLRTEARR